MALSAPLISPRNSPRRCCTVAVSLNPELRSPLGWHSPRQGAATSKPYFNKCHGHFIYQGHKKFTSWGICREFRACWHAHEGCVSPWKQRAAELGDSSHGNVFCLPTGERPAVSNADKAHTQSKSIWAKSG